MSHRDDCPTGWEARRHGERAYERGYGSNPYRGGSGEEGCDEAEREWRRGYNAAERRAEEQHAKEAAARRRAEARRQDEEYLYAHQEQESEPEPDPGPEPVPSEDQ